MTKQEVLRVVSVSGGKDSTALYLWAIEQFGKDGFRAVFADTGNEHPITYNYVSNLHIRTGGPKVEWVVADFSRKLKAKGIEPSGNPFLDLWLMKGRAPSATARFCTDAVKLTPIRDWLSTIRGLSEVEIYVGVRAAESQARAKLPMEEDSDFYEAIVKRPLLKWSDEAVFLYLKNKGMELNPLYEHGSARVGCYPCIHSRKSELASMEVWAWDRLSQWEERADTTWFSFGTIPLTQDQVLALKRAEEWEQRTCKDCGGKGYVRADFDDYDCPVCQATGKVKVLTEAASLRVAKLKIEYSPRVEQVREWAKTARGGKQFDMFPPDEKDVPTCMSTWGVCE